jgi:hypothetical protein
VQRQSLVLSSDEDELDEDEQDLRDDDESEQEDEEDELEATAGQATTRTSRLQHSYLAFLRQTFTSPVAPLTTRVRSAFWNVLTEV